MSASGHYCVDLDGTLAHYGAWNGGAIGDPIPAMVERVKRWLAEGIEVRIFTARVACSGMTNEHGQTDEPSFVAEQTALIQDWTERHLGARLRVTATKDFSTIEIWDDRCVQVATNTGDPIGGSRQFPDGKLNQEDEGELTMALGVDQGNVVLNFGKPVGWLALPPQAACDLARGLLAKAAAIQGFATVELP